MKLTYVVIFLSMIFILSFTSRINESNNITIVLDAGHGGKDQGAVVDGIFEADINLKITLKLKDILTNNGIDVILTRSGNYDLSTDKNNRKRSDAKNRVRLVNESNAHLFVSIHLNKFPVAKYYGTQVFFSPNIPINKVIASSVQQEFVNNTNTTRKAKEIRNVFIIDKIRIPGILVEAGFMSNPEELTLLQTTKHQELIAQTIFKGIYGHLLVF